MNQKGLAPIFILIGILVVAFVAWGAYYFGYDYGWEKSAKTQTLQTTPTSSPIPDETADWKTYSNNTFKFQLDYPAAYEVDSNEGKVCIGKNDIFCKLMINITPIKDYKLIDNSGGFIFYFDVVKKSWFHDKTNDPSQFIPKRADANFEAYTYKTGDGKCLQEYTLIPTNSYTEVIEIINTSCKDDEGNPTEITTFTQDQILSTFKFTN